MTHHNPTLARKRATPVKTARVAPCAAGRHAQPESQWLEHLRTVLAIVALFA
jgi:hypothetical protein